MKARHEIYTQRFQQAPTEIGDAIHQCVSADITIEALKAELIEVRKQRDALWLQHDRAREKLEKLRALSEE